MQVDAGDKVGSGRSPGGGHDNPLQCSCLENPIDREAWGAIVHRVAKSWTRLSDFPFTFNFHALEKEMATHSSVLAWRIPGMGESGTHKKDILGGAGELLGGHTQDGII